MPPISDEIKAFIVRSLATFDTPSEVVDSVKNNFGVELSRQHVYGYDPECSKLPAQRWRELHAATRASYLERTADISITHQTWRLRMLDKMAHHAIKNFYWGRAQSLLDQAAMECGGHYERERRERASSAPQVPNLPEYPVTPQRRNAREVSPAAELPEG